MSSLEFSLESSLEPASAIDQSISNHPLANIWFNVRNLLCCVGRNVTAAHLQPAFNMLHQTLPSTQVTLKSQTEIIQAENQMWKGRAAITALQPFDAVIIFTAPLYSPYTIAYLCYLAGIPIRAGQSLEFAGSLLTHCVCPPADLVTPEEYHLHLLKSIFS